MAVNHDHRGEVDRTPTGFSVAAGCALVTVAALLAAAVFPADELPGRLLILAVTAGAYASVVADLRAVAAVSGLAVAVFVGFLANRYGDLTGAGADVWWHAALIGFAGALGAGYRWMRTVLPADRESAAPDAVSVSRPRPDRFSVVAPPDDLPGGSRGA